jgi:hypothetical protein
MEDHRIYKGYEIKLLARMLDDGKWWCNAAGIDPSKIRPVGFNLDAEAATEEESKQQALKKVRELIDARSA